MTAFIVLRYIPSAPTFFKAFIMKERGILSKTLFCFYRESHVISVFKLM